MFSHHPVTSLACVFLMWRLTRCYASTVGAFHAHPTAQHRYALPRWCLNYPHAPRLSFHRSRRARFTTYCVGHNQQCNGSRGLRKLCAYSCLICRNDSFLNMQITVTIASSISFHANPNLRSLEISTYCLHPFIPCNTSWLQAIVTTITSHSFEDITQWFRAPQRNQWVERFDFQSLERTLLQRVDPLALPILHTKFVQTPAWRVAHNDGLVAAVERPLPELRKRGLLVVYSVGQPLSKALDGWWPYVW